MANSLVLVIEDDDDVRTLLRLLLEAEGYEVAEAPDGEGGLERVEIRAPDLVLLDIRLPGIKGLDVCRVIRRTSDVPVIMVTANDDSHDVVAGLEAGADDYVTKPFVDKELLARIRVQLRRTAAPLRDQDVVRVGPIEVRSGEGVVLRNGEPVKLTKTEFHLLHHLVSNPNRVLSRDSLLVQVWGYEYAGDGRVVDTHISRLRAKVEDDPANPTIVQTVRGLGYKVVP